MRLAYLDPFSGVSGDLFLGALVDAGVPLADLQAAVDSLGIDGLMLDSEKTQRAGIEATKVTVTFPLQHEHRHLSDIVTLIENSGLPVEVKERSSAVFLQLAKAESAVHGVDLEQVHFHEVGAADALADVVGSVMGLKILAVDECLVGSINVGSGTVMCDHGELPVPAPATLALLTGLACHVAGPSQELTTPTGAALVKTLSHQVDAMPALCVTGVGYGAGDSDPAGWPNVLRLIVGDAR